VEVDIERRRYFVIRTANEIFILFAIDNRRAIRVLLQPEIESKPNGSETSSKEIKIDDIVDIMTNRELLNIGKRRNMNRDSNELINLSNIATEES
jgi:hypothetical protein